MLSSQLFSLSTALCSSYNKVETEEYRHPCLPCIEGMPMIKETQPLTFIVCTFRLASAKEALMEWVGGLMESNGQQSSVTGSSSSRGSSKSSKATASVDGTAQALASTLLDPSPASTMVIG